MGYIYDTNEKCFSFHSRLHIELCLAMITNNVDLIVIEGMGRTLHTNLYAKLKCECLKLAIVKNKWLALHLGGEMYAVICKYERACLESAKVEEKMQNQVNRSISSSSSGEKS